MFRQLLCSDWRHSMSTSLLYHAFGIRGYTYTQTAFVGGTIHLWIRHVHSIPSGCPEGPAACKKGYRGDGRCTAQVAAERLNVTVSTIAAWCQSGRLDGIQAVPNGPWWIRLTPEIITELRKPVRRCWSRSSGA